MVSKQALAYDPSTSYQVEVSELEYLRHGDEGWLVRIYQPVGAGPFPALVDVHGGAWNRGDRTHSDLRAPQLAATGVVVASVDFRLGSQTPLSSAGCRRQFRDPLAERLTPPISTPTQHR